jgi:hypothetical protein
VGSTHRNDTHRNDTHRNDTHRNGGVATTVDNSIFLM